MLLDTPGILWPKIENPQGSYRLGTTGAIKDTAVSYEDLAFFAAEFLLEAYPQRLRERFNVEELPRTEIALLEIIGAQRGCLRSGGKVDLERVSTIFINELRAGLLGPLGFETPEIIESEMLQVAVLKEEKAEREKLRLDKAATRRRKAKSNRK
jgi:ribosome biogenesis GTPase A